VTMLVRDKTLAASMSQYLSDRILGAANVQVRYDVEITGLDGGRALERIRIGSRTTKEANWAATPRLFVAIGGGPNTDWGADTAIVRDQGGYLVTGPDLLITARTQPPGLWSARPTTWRPGFGLLGRRGCAPPLDQARRHRSG
jgi:thioredoxin reductase (NADPH)